MRYFKNRTEAGKLLADKLDQHKTKNCAVVCLNEGGVVVGLEIAKKIHSSLYLLTTENVNLPGEPEPFATLTTAGTFTYNTSGYSTGELEELSIDYRSLVDQNRLEAFQKLNRISKDEGEISKAYLKNHHIILASDGFKTGLSLDVSADFLKPIKYERLIVAVPIASVPVVDKMHLLADEIQCLSVIDDYMTTDHYYEDNSIPPRAQIIKMAEQATLNWDNESPNIKP